MRQAEWDRGGGKRKRSAAFGEETALPAVDRLTTAGAAAKHPPLQKRPRRTGAPGVGLRSHGEKQSKNNNAPVSKTKNDRSVASGILRNISVDDLKAWKRKESLTQKRPIASRNTSQAAGPVRRNPAKKTTEERSSNKPQPQQQRRSSLASFESMFIGSLKNPDAPVLAPPRRRPSSSSASSPSIPKQKPKTTQNGSLPPTPRERRRQSAATVPPIHKREKEEEGERTNRKTQPALLSKEPSKLNTGTETEPKKKKKKKKKKKRRANIGYAIHPSWAAKIQLREKQLGLDHWRGRRKKFE